MYGLYRLIMAIKHWWTRSRFTPSKTTGSIDPTVFVELWLWHTMKADMIKGDVHRILQDMIWTVIWYDQIIWTSPVINRWKGLNFRTEPCKNRRYVALQEPGLLWFTRRHVQQIEHIYIYVYIHNMYIHICALFGNVLLFYVSINHNYQLDCLVFLLVSPVWILWSGCVNGL